MSKEVMDPAYEAANRFITRINNGTLMKEILPNSAEDYTGCHEQADLESYKMYMKTIAYEDYVANRTVLYYGD